MDTKPPAVGVVQLASANEDAAELEQGRNMIVPLVGRFAETTITSPSAVVLIEATYLLVDDAASQPQLPAVGSEEPEGKVWTVSVIDVRQADAARISSDTLALTV